MGDAIVMLHAAVLLAALVQAATGIGFGVLAGPVILIALNSGSAIQISMMLSLLIAAVLTPSLARGVDWPLLRRVLLGSLAGFPAGIVVFLLVSVDVLKLLAGGAVLFMALSAAGYGRRAETGGGPRLARDLAVGAVSGAMNTSLAMPGPVVAARMAARRQSKDVVRATVLVTLVFSYIVAIAFQAAFVGLGAETLALTATLVPATLAGAVIGKLAAARIGETGFRRMVTVLLAITSLGLIVNSLMGILGFI